MYKCDKREGYPLENKKRNAEKPMDRSSKASGTGKIVAIVLACLLVVIAVVILFNFKTVKALYEGITRTKESIEADIHKNQEDTAKALAQSGIALSSDDLARAESGEMTEEEIRQMVLDALNASGSPVPSDVPDVGGIGAQPNDPGTDTVPPEKPETVGDPKLPDEGKTPTDGTQPTDQKTPGGKPTETQPETPTGKPTEGSTGKPGAKPTEKPTTPKGGTVTDGKKLSEDVYNAKVADLVAKVYVLKGQYTSLLSSFESQIIAQYNALPKEQHTAATKARLVSENVGYVAGLEAQCDAQIAAITDELTTLMKENGKDTLLADSIKSAYANEKELKKAYYISLYK